MFVVVGVFVVQSRDQGVGVRDSVFDSGTLRASSRAVALQALEKALEIKGGRVVSLKLHECLLDFGLIGSAFVSECFFLALLFNSGRYRHLAGVAFVGRVIHLVVGAALIFLLVNPAASLPWPFSPRQPLRQLYNLRNFKENIKLNGLLCLLATLDVTLFRYLPWLHSQFSVETKGFPSPFVFMACISSKLAQSFFTSSCQVVFLSGTSRDKAFLALNVAVTVVIFLVNAVEAALWSGLMREWQTAGAGADDARAVSALGVELADTATATAAATSNPVLALAASSSSSSSGVGGAEPVDSIPAPSLPRKSGALQAADIESEMASTETGAGAGAGTGTGRPSRL